MSPTVRPAACHPLSAEAVRIQPGRERAGSGRLGSPGEPGIFHNASHEVGHVSGVIVPENDARQSLLQPIVKAPDKTGSWDSRPVLVSICYRSSSFGECCTDRGFSHFTYVRYVHYI